MSYKINPFINELDDIGSGGGGGGAVSSVSNSDGSLTVSPTTGVVVASLNVAHANTFSALQTFNAGVTIKAGQKLIFDGA